MKSTITLRALEPADVDTLYFWENLPDVEQVSLSDAPISHYALWQYVESYTGNIFAERQLRLMIEADGKPVGTVDISDFAPRHHRAMLGIMIAPEYRRRGYAQQAVERAIAYCQEIGMHQLTAMVAGDNTASLRLFEKAGFTTSGVLHSWLLRGTTYTDAVILQKIFE